MCMGFFRVVLIYLVVTLHYKKQTTTENIMKIGIYNAGDCSDVKHAIKTGALHMLGEVACSETITLDAMNTNLPFDIKKMISASKETTRAHGYSTKTFMYVLFTDRDIPRFETNTESNALRWSEVKREFVTIDLVLLDAIIDDITKSIELEDEMSMSHNVDELKNLIIKSRNV